MGQAEASPVCCLQGINAIIFYAPVLFEQLGGQGLGSLLNTVVIDAGEHMTFCSWPLTRTCSLYGCLYSNALNAE